MKSVGFCLKKNKTTFAYHRATPQAFEIFCNDYSVFM